MQVLQILYVSDGNAVAKIEHDGLEHSISFRHEQDLNAEGLLIVIQKALETMLKFKIKKQPES